MRLLADCTRPLIDCCPAHASSPLTNHCVRACDRDALTSTVWQDHEHYPPHLLVGVPASSTSSFLTVFLEFETVSGSSKALGLPSLRLSWPLSLPPDVLAFCLRLRRCGDVQLQGNATDNAIS